MQQQSNHQLKVARIVHAEEAVFFHLRNTLDLFDGSYDLTVIAPKNADFPKRWPKVHWVELPMQRQANPLSDLVCVIKLYQILRASHFDIIHSLGPKASLLSATAGFFARVPVRLHTFTGQVWATKTGLFRWALKQSDRLVCALNTQCYTDSLSQKKFLEDENIPTNNKPLKVLADGSLAGVNFNSIVDSDLQSFRVLFRQRNKIPENKMVFVFLGRKSKDKGVFDFLSAVENLATKRSDFVALFVGPDEGGFTAAVKDLNEKVRAQIIEIGRVTDPLSYLFTGDVLVLPSYREGFGTVVIEAAALGRPTIGTDIVGLVDAIENGKTGLLVPTKDANTLANVIEQLINNPDHVSSLGKAAKNRAAEKFSAEVLYSALTNEYQRLVKNVH